MADKDFKVKNKLFVNGLSHNSGVILATNNNLDSHTTVPTQYGGTGTTQSPTSGQILYSSAGTNYAPTSLTSLSFPASYTTSEPASPIVGQIWIDSDSDSLSFDTNIVRRQAFTATAGQTNFVTTVAFIDGYEQVYFNGLLLLRSTDYTTSGTNTIVLTSAAAANDIVEVVTITNLNSINTYTQAEVDSALAAKLSISTAASTYLTQSNASSTYLTQSNASSTYAPLSNPTFSAIGGDEGGQINLAAAATNSTLSGPINLDVWRNRVRLFENGGNNRGAFIDLSTLSNGVGSELVAASTQSGNSGKYLVTNGTTAVWQENQIAGKNKIINGDFGVWQRGTSISLTSGNGFYFADRFYGSCSFSAGTASFSQQTFTPGAAPVAGYEGQYFARLTCGSTSTHFSTYQKIEDVRTFAGTTATYSFWAKASTNVTVALYGVQGFGSGGSANVDVTISPSTASLTTSWQRFTATVTVPSVSGKTIGTGSTLTIGYYYSSGNINSATIDLWGVQLEAGSVATSFQTATGNPQGELAACQRYYWRNGGIQISGGIQSSYDNNVWVTVSSINTVPMRTTPTAAIEGPLYITDFGANLRNVSSVSIVTKNIVGFAYSSTKLTTSSAYGININDTGAALSFSAEYSL